ncbi:Spy/CpxP family protein refolding chaperone [Phenylobacterium sp. J426]|uniref:Spy/CpxP family protein refolding chaperone n=1 Tax=Phenylobacterium sp. J426 TaxID=2898439 RepID=UPI002151A788|nr:Spy/CpxP family protein refolding chaperone [Phenylobacterium sp. J426]MCR5873769.1 Spy/CpxP family protein refolding chaperone [Phenylobacterium sp. J426]
MNRTLTCLLAGATLAATAGIALAHDASAEAAREQARTDARPERHVHVYRSDDSDRDRKGPRKNVMIYRSGEGREQHLKDVLQLRPNQEPALKAFLAATQPEPGRHDVVKFGKDDLDKSTAERLAQMEAKADEHHQAMKRRIAATRTFYAQLDEKQKKAFDAMPMLMMAGPGFGPMMIPVGHHMPAPPMPPMPPRPPMPPAPPAPGDI